MSNMEDTDDEDTDDEEDAIEAAFEEVKGSYFDRERCVELMQLLTAALAQFDAEGRDE